MSTPLPTRTVAERLCLACGFCCDGTLFTRVQLRPEDSVEKLKSTELNITQDDQGQWIMKQPCSSYREGQCHTYTCRPSRCGIFQCTLLKNVDRGSCSEEEALGIIQDTKHTRDQLTSELHKLFPEFRKRAMAENLRRLRKESRKLRGERLKLFRAERKNIMQLKTQLSEQLDSYFYVPDESTSDQTNTNTKK